MHSVLVGINNLLFRFVLRRVLLFSFHIDIVVVDDTFFEVRLLPSRLPLLLNWFTIFVVVLDDAVEELPLPLLVWRQLWAEPSPPPLTIEISSASVR